MVNPKEGQTLVPTFFFLDSNMLDSPLNQEFISCAQTRQTITNKNTILFPNRFLQIQRGEIGNDFIKE